jgi:MFS family permease
MLSLAILLAVHDQFDSFAVAGLAVGAFTLGLAAAAPVLGAAVDRLGPRTVLPPVALAHASFDAGLGLSVIAGAPRLAVIVLALLSGAAVPPISASVRAVWMRVIADDQVRQQVFAFDAIATQAVFAGGPLLTSLIVVIASPSAAIFVAAFLALVGTAIYVSSPLLPRADGDPLTVARRAAQRRRFGVLASGGLVSVLGCVMLVGASGGVIEVTLPALAVHLGSRAASGVLVGLWAAAGVAGGLVYARVRWASPIRVRYRVAAVACGVLTLPLLWASSIGSAVALSVVAGLPIAALYACQYSIVGGLAPAESITESFTWLTVAIVAGGGLGNVLAGAVITAAGVPVSFGLAAALPAVIVLIPFRSPSG